MKSNTPRVALGAALVIVAVVLLIVLKDDGSDTSNSNSSASGPPAKSGEGPPAKSPAKQAVPTIVIRNGKPVGGIAELTYDAGERVRFKVTSDVSEEIHVHGYDIAKEVEAGGSVSFDFPADIEGVFEAELEGQGVQILELTVNP